MYLGIPGTSRSEKRQLDKNKSNPYYGILAITEFIYLGVGVARDTLL